MAVGLSDLPELYPVPGVRLSAVAAGLRYRNRPDLVLISCDEGTRVAGVFTRNRYVAAPVIVAREHLDKTTTRALLINAGQANAGTGAAGEAVSRECCALAAKALDIQTEAVLPFSTGVIGNAPPVEGVEASMSSLVAGLAEDNWAGAAHGIMTTDTVAKGSSQRIELGGKTVTVTGICKGSGMIHPNMATMLAYVATDAAVEQGLLAQLWQQAIDQSFNRITVDGDTSTNDAAIVLATGRAGNQEITSRTDKDAMVLLDALVEVCQELAHSIIRDGEGATKFVTVSVEQGASETDCLAIAFTVAHSPLVKTALFASDPNWGRILAAVGRAPVEQLDMATVDLYINEVCVASQGAVDPGYTEEAGQAAMAPEEIVIRVLLNSGTDAATVWTTDLSHDYIRINAEYRS